MGDIQTNNFGLIEISFSKFIIGPLKKTQCGEEMDMIIILWRPLLNCKIRVFINIHFLSGYLIDESGRHHLKSSSVRLKCRQRYIKIKLLIEKLKICALGNLHYKISREKERNPEVRGSNPGSGSGSNFSLEIS